MAEKMLNSFDIQDSIADDDIVLGYDKSENKVKNFKFGTGIWDWIVDKMANAVVSKLTTTDKTVLGAINELNSKSGMQILDTSTNLNVVNKTGFYTVQNPVNAPIGTATGWSNLIVMNAGNNINLLRKF